MTTEKLNKAKVLIAQGQNELSRVKEPLEIGFDGKVRTICRRAVGFYIAASLELFPKDNYGKSFMNNIRALASDNEAPQNVKLSADKLLVHTNTLQLSGSEAVKCAETIILFCKNIVKPFLKL